MVESARNQNPNHETDVPSEGNPLCRVHFPEYSYRSTTAGKFIASRSVWREGETNVGDNIIRGNVELVEGGGEKWNGGEEAG